MLFAAVVLVAWTGLVEDIGVLPYLYVDDMLFIDNRDNHIVKHEEALTLTHQYMLDIFSLGQH